MRMKYRGATIQTIVTPTRGAGVNIIAPETFWSIKGEYDTLDQAIEAAKKAIDRYIETNRGRTICK